MHILITNDDGPPSPHSSPYVHSLISELQKAGHTISVCLPHTQRSWIGKAHMIGQTVKPLYYRPSTELHGEQSEGATSTRPSPGAEEWILVDGTPASCVQIGLHHFFKDRGPIDLVVSGPNYGRNTTAVFALSSGTLGGALEAAVCKRKAIAISYAFFSRNHDPVIIGGASRHSVKVIEALYKQWPTDGSVDLYSVNVPLVEDVESHKTLWTGMLQNYWRDGSCFEEVDGSVGDEDEEEERIREGAQGEVEEGKEKKPAEEDGKSHRHKHFKWNPRFTDVYRSVDEAPPGNDGWAVKEGYTSVTPLKANFWHPKTELHQKELILPDLRAAESAPRLELPVRPLQEAGEEKGQTNGPNVRFYAIIAYDDPYVQPLILSAMKTFFPDDAWKLLPYGQDGPGTDEISLADLVPFDDAKVLHITPYETIDFEYAAKHPETCLVNSYMIRKALIRKHYLSATVENWVAKNPHSVLKTHVKRSEAFEVDYAEFLDDALVEAWDLRESMERNAGRGRAAVLEVEVSEGVTQADGSDSGETAAMAPEEREWWILKPGMSDRGQGIKLFSTMDELQSIFDTWEDERPESDGEDEDEDEDTTEGKGEAPENSNTDEGDYITTSHLRHFVAQPYIHPPLLLPSDSRKFHIRTYVLCVGSLSVYVYKDMLALFAGQEYAPPWETSDLSAHLTNTCLQQSASGSASPVKRFRDLDIDAGLAADIVSQICDITGEVFEAAARGMTVHFQPLSNAFEVFGLDFLVDARGVPWLLEVNAFPDFKQTGGDLQAVVAEFWTSVLRHNIEGFFGVEAKREEEGGWGSRADELVLVRRVELGWR